MTGRELVHAVSPPFISLLGDMKIPVDSQKKCHLVLVDLEGIKTRDFAPSAGRVVAVLKVL